MSTLWRNMHPDCCLPPAVTSGLVLVLVLVWSGLVWSGRVGSGRVGFVRVWSGRVGSGRVGSGLVWSGLVFCLVLVFSRVFRMLTTSVFFLTLQIGGQTKKKGFENWDCRVEISGPRDTPKRAHRDRRGEAHTGIMMTQEAEGQRRTLCCWCPLLLVFKGIIGSVRSQYLLAGLHGAEGAGVAKGALDAFRIAIVSCWLVKDISSVLLSVSLRPPPCPPRACARTVSQGASLLDQREMPMVNPPCR